MKKFSRRTFADQIRYFYIMLFLVVFFLCGSLYLFSTYKIMSNSENNTLRHSLQIVENNMESLIRNVNDNSKLIAYNENVQEMLGSAGEISYEESLKLQDAVIQMAACCDGISSVFLFDETGKSYIAGNIYEVEEIRAWLDETSHYENQLMENSAEATGTSIFSYETYLDPDRQIISMIRPVKNLSTLEEMGLLAINIPVSRIIEAWHEISIQNHMEVAVFDQTGNVICSTENGEWLAELTAEKEPGTEGESYTTEKLGDKKYIVGKAEQEDELWTIVGAIPKGQSIAEIRQYAILSIVILIYGMTMCVFGASYQTGKIIRPVQNILNSMERVQQGILERIPVKETNKEIDNLQEHYNQMLEEIERLMSQKVEEQRMRRKYELSLLQAQIRPHFLYNTFDSVCALAMMGRTEDVYTMMQALGQYYRNSLHKGQEIIMVKEELKIVENYLIIQSYRYEDVFEVAYDIDDSITGCSMIKLILQPLVENAIYHGFREHELQGTITIRAKDDGEYVKLQVEDDGIGMEQEKLDQVLNRTEENQEKRFGLFGTIQRIQLYYQQEDLVEIRSAVGRGTVITVIIPKEKGDDNVKCIGD